MQGGALSAPRELRDGGGGRLPQGRSEGGEGRAGQGRAAAARDSRRGGGGRQVHVFGSVVELLGVAVGGHGGAGPGRTALGRAAGSTTLRGRGHVRAGRDGQAGAEQLSRERRRNRPSPGGSEGGERKPRDGRRPLEELLWAESCAHTMLWESALAPSSCWPPSRPTSITATQRQERRIPVCGCP